MCTPVVIDDSFILSVGFGYHNFLLEHTFKYDMKKISMLDTEKPLSKCSAYFAMCLHICYAQILMQYGLGDAQVNILVRGFV